RVKLLDLAKVHLLHRIAPGGGATHEAVVHQHAQRLANRTPADAELLAESLLGQAMLRRILPCNDAFLERRHDRAAKICISYAGHRITVPWIYSPCRIANLMSGDGGRVKGSPMRRMAPVLGSASSSAWSRWMRIETPQRGGAKNGPGTAGGAADSARPAT